MRRHKNELSEQRKKLLEYMYYLQRAGEEITTKKLAEARGACSGSTNTMLQRLKGQGYVELVLEVPENKSARIWKLIKLPAFLRKNPLEKNHVVED